MKTIAFFNNKGGVGKTSLVYHLAYMFADLGHHVLAVDLDPQANLTSMFLDEDKIEALLPAGVRPKTVLGIIQPLLERAGDINDADPVIIDSHIALLAGDLGLSAFEDRLSAAWTNCLDDEKNNSADGVRVTTAFYRMVKAACDKMDSAIALIDVGPSIGAMNRSALVAADFVVIPLGADLFSLRGLENLGPSLNSWRTGWQTRREKAGKAGVNLSLPAGEMKPIGYVLFNPSVRENRPVRSYQKWANRIPAAYLREILGSQGRLAVAEPDPNCLAMIKHFKSLMPMAQEVRKPMFHLTAADGAIGSHASAVTSCRTQFQALCERIRREIDFPIDPA